VNAAGIEGLLQRINNDLTILPPESFVLIGGDLGTVLSTGDQLKIKLGNATFASNNGTIAPTNLSEAFLTII